MCEIYILVVDPGGEMDIIVGATYGEMWDKEYQIIKDIWASCPDVTLVSEKIEAIYKFMELKAWPIQWKQVSLSEIFGDRPIKIEEAGDRQEVDLLEDL